MPVSNVLLFVFAAILLVLLLAFLIYEFRQTRLHRRRVRMLYASPVMDELQHGLRFAKKHAAELITVDKNGVYLRFLSPGYGEYFYLMEEHGFAQLTPQQQSAMRTVLEERLPHLAEKSHYRLTRKTIQLPNGKIEYAFSYTMTNSYKEQLTRAPHYAPRMTPYSG